MSIRSFLALLLLTLAAGPVRALEILAPTHYDLSLSVDCDEEVLAATAAITLQNPSKTPETHVSLLLYRLLKVSAVRDAEGKKLEFRQNVVSIEGYGKQQVNHVVVDLAKPLDAGATTTIQIEYNGYLLGYAETGMRYIQDRISREFTMIRDDAYAYPIPGLPSIKKRRDLRVTYTYSARITVPKDLIVANGGRLEGVTTAGERTTYVFSSIKPSWRMDFAVAKFGELTEGPIRIYYLPGDREGAAGVAAAATTAMALFSSRFGPLRATPQLTFIEIPDGWGSQADVTTVIQTAAAFRDPTRLHEVYHEISHLWNPPDTDVPSPRWNEGLASFLEHLVDQEVTRQPAADRRAQRLLEWLRTSLPANPDWKEVPLTAYGQKGKTDLSYSVGALFFDQLYRLTGPENFNTIIRTYVSEHSERGGTISDLADTIRKIAGPRSEPLLKDWIFTTGWAPRVEQSTDLESLTAQYLRE